MSAPLYISAVVLLVSSALYGEPAPVAAAASATRVTPVAGESWLKHLGRPFESTSMGKSTWRLGPNTPEPAQLAESWQESVTRDLTSVSMLNGSDQYRQNCRGCHGETGAGFVPEINSLIDPVRATSPLLIMQRMKKVGVSMGRAQAEELGGQAQAALLQRIHGGGQDMPAFAYLNEAEVRSLVAYLRELADIPNAASGQMRVAESSTEIGEHIAKSLCHVCHSAEGLNPTPEQLESGAIPPLSVLTSRKNLAGFVQKVTHGAPIIMGNPSTPHAGRMPVFDYLTQDEVADVYFYLTLYPPKQPDVNNTTNSPLAATLTGTSPQPDNDNDPDPPAPPQPTENNLASAKSGDLVPQLFVIGAISFTAFLLLAGAGLTVVVFSRFANNKAGRKSADEVSISRTAQQNYAA